MIGSAAFFAPLTETRPRRGCPPRTTNMSILGPSPLTIFQLSARIETVSTNCGKPNLVRWLRMGGQKAVNCHRAQAGDWLIFPANNWDLSMVAMPPDVCPSGKCACRPALACER